MDRSLPDDKAITVPVPIVDVTAEAQSESLVAADITHFVVQLSDKRFDLLMQSIAGIPYDMNNPWSYWFYIGKVVSKAFFQSEDQLQWFNAVRVHTREFIAFSNISIPSQVDISRGSRNLQVVEIDFSKPQPSENIKLFWKPARGLIRQNIDNRLDYESEKKTLTLATSIK